MEFSGEYVVGKGEGSFYLMMDEYVSQIKNKLGFKPFPGTFNVKVKDEVVQVIEQLEFISLSGFEQDDKVYGGCDVRPAVVERLPAFIILPERTTHPSNILEFISYFELRKELKLKPGDKVSFEI